MIGRQIREMQITIALDDGEQVVEVVGHSSGQTPHRLHFLGLTELRFQRSALSDVAGDELEPHGMAVLKEEAGGQIQVAALAVFGHGVELGNQFGTQAGHAGPEQLLCSRQLRGVHQIEERLTEVFLTRVAADFFGLAIHRGKPARQVCGENNVVGVFEQIAIALLAAPQGLFRFLAIGNVTEGSQNAGHTAETD